MNRRHFIKAVLTVAAVAAFPKGVLPDVPPGSGRKKMKITVLTGSPHEKGTSALLADEFIRGATEAGHEVFRFNAAFEDVHPCIGCDRCGLGARKCVFNDAMDRLNPHLLEADVLVFVTPLYYFGMSAQLKTVIDRFYANNYRIMEGGRKSILMATAWNNDDWTMTDLTHHYRTLVRYLKMQDVGMVLAKGCGRRSDIENSDYPQQAYRLGKSL